MQGYVEQALTDLYGVVRGTSQDKRADLPVGAYTESQYSPIVYGKAALFFNAVYETLGDEKFNQLMQDYYQTYRYGVAYPKDLLAIAAKYVGPAELDELVKEWITGP
jgi:aminopeptidase N